MVEWKRIYDTNGKKAVISIGGIALISVWFWLHAQGYIVITNYSGDMMCAGTEEDPCFATITFTPVIDIFLYPGEDWAFSTDVELKDVKLQRSWGTGWREIPLDKGCTGSWCGCYWCTKTQTAVFTYAFRAGREYTLKITGYKVDAFEDVKWSFGAVDPVWSGVGEYKLVKKPIEGRAYTPTCLSECHLTVNFSLYNDISLAKSDFTRRIKKQVGDFEIRDWGFDYLRNVTYLDTIENKTEVCSPYDLWDDANNTWYNYPNCTWITNPYQTEKWKWEWRPVPNNINIKANKFYVIDLWVKRKPTLGKSMMDIVPKIKNYEMGNLAWWNSSWDYSRNITFTEQSIQSQALSKYPIAYYVPEGSTCAHSNCSDFRVLNSSQDEIDFNITVYNASHYYIVHNLTVEAAGTVDYEVYYGNSGASETSNFKTWTFMRARQDSFEDGDFANNPTWTQYQSGGGSASYIHGSGKELDYALNITTDGSDDDGAYGLSTPLTITNGSSYGFWVKWSHPAGAYNYHGRVNIDGVATEFRCQIHHTNGTYLACDIAGGGWMLVYTPIQANTWYREVFDFNYTANTINITIYDANMTHLNSTLFANTAETENIVYVNQYDGTATKESFLVDLASYGEGIVEPEPSVSIGSETTPPAPPVPVPNVTLYLNGTATDKYYEAGEIVGITCGANMTSNNSMIVNSSRTWIAASGIKQLNNSNYIQNFTFPSIAFPPNASDVSHTLHWDFYNLLNDSDWTSVAFNYNETYSANFYPNYSIPGGTINANIIAKVFYGVNCDTGSRECWLEGSVWNYDTDSWEYVLNDTDSDNTKNLTIFLSDLTPYNDEGSVVLNLTAHSKWGKTGATAGYFETGVIFSNTTAWLRFHSYDRIINATWNISSYQSGGYYPTDTKFYINGTQSGTTITGELKLGTIVTITSLNDSSTSKNFTYGSAGTQTDYIYLPKGGIISNAFMNFSGFNYSCDTGADDDTPDAAGGPGAGEWTDQNWGTYYSPGYCPPGTTTSYEMLENYTVPANIHAANVTLKFSAYESSTGTPACGITEYYWNYTSAAWKMLSAQYMKTSAIDAPETKTYVIGTDGFESDSPLMMRTIGSRRCDATNTFRYYEQKIVWYNNTCNITNPYLDIGLNGTKDWNYTGEFAFNGTQDKTGNLTTVVQDYLDSSSCVGDDNNFCNVPLGIYTASPGIMQLSDIQIDYLLSSMEITLDKDLINSYLQNSSGYVDLPISISSDTSGITEIDASNFTYWGSNVYNITCYNSTDQTELNLHVVYSNFTINLPYTWTDYVIFLPVSNSSVNVTPWEQTDTTPIFNITPRAYYNNFSIAMSLNTTPDSCLNFTVSNTSSKDDGFNITTTQQQIWDSVNVSNTTENKGIWMWLDMQNCNETNAWAEYERRIDTCCESCMSCGW